MNVWWKSVNRVKVQYCRINVSSPNWTSFTASYFVTTLLDTSSIFLPSGRQDRETFRKEPTSQDAKPQIQPGVKPPLPLVYITNVGGGVVNPGLSPSAWIFIAPNSQSGQNQNVKNMDKSWGDNFSPIMPCQWYVRGGGEGKRQILIGQSVPPTPFGMAFGRLKLSPQNAEPGF
jgi:hypothetical protein